MQSKSHVLSPVAQTRYQFPDKSGNPDLRPELANGIDITYERFSRAPDSVKLGANLEMKF